MRRSRRVSRSAERCDGVALYLVPARSPQEGLGACGGLCASGRCLGRVGARAVALPWRGFGHQGRRRRGRAAIGRSDVIHAGRHDLFAVYRRFSLCRRGKHGNSPGCRAAAGGQDNAERAGDLPWGLSLRACRSGRAECRSLRCGRPCRDISVHHRGDRLCRPGAVSLDRTPDAVRADGRYAGQGRSRDRRSAGVASLRSLHGWARPDRRA